MRLKIDMCKSGSVHKWTDRPKYFSSTDEAQVDSSRYDGQRFTLLRMN